MPTRRVIKGVLHSFLGTYTSRYSDFGGYWLFGFLVNELVSEQFDLLSPPSGDQTSALAQARLIAAHRFFDQLRKARLDRSIVTEAILRMERLPKSTKCIGNGFARAGFDLRFTATAVTDLGHRFACEQIIFVAPHDPRIEFQRAL